MNSEFFSAKISQSAQKKTYCTASQPISMRHFAYRPDSELSHIIKRNIDQGQLTRAVFIDLRKAFEHLELKWFENYLTNREQVVGYQNALSKPQSVAFGVPQQGSIIGPLLFIVLVNDLPSARIPCSMPMYADDTVLFYSSKDVRTIQKKLNEKLSLIEISQ